MFIQYMKTKLKTSPRWQQRDGENCNSNLVAPQQMCASLSALARSYRDYDLKHSEGFRQPTPDKQNYSWPLNKICKRCPHKASQSLKRVRKLGTRLPLRE